MKNPTTFWEESRTQCSIVSFLRKHLPGTYRVISIPNGRFKADPITIGRLKREGLTPGAPDLLLLRNDGWFAAIEVKASKGKLGPDQVEWSEWLTSGCAEMAVVRSLDEAVEVVTAWGVPLSGRVAA